MGQDCQGQGLVGQCGQEIFVVQEVIPAAVGHGRHIIYIGVQELKLALRIAGLQDAVDPVGGAFARRKDEQLRVQHAAVVNAAVAGIGIYGFLSAGRRRQAQGK